MTFIVSVLICAAAYLIGSIPFAYIFVRQNNNVDIRKVGSGNVGSTNSLRIGGWKTALPVFACDILKGTVPTLAAHIIGGDLLALFAGLCAFFGHIFPIWLNFRGGKGVATGLGLVLALSPVLIIPCAVVFILTVVISGYVSLASCLAAATICIGAILTQQPWLITLLYCLGTVVICLRHKENFRKMANGTESKMFRHK